MNSKLPPVPAANRSDKGSGAPRENNASVGQKPAENPDKIGQQGNSKVNTTHQGYQQDR
ncbi:hypothetical protein FHX06_006608 [Rhizobium sp. BK512]|uniref:hypothetical protein n=1 Tax=Rhizobium sp. BK512 TaxID=2587010 RepID=UPI00161D1A19|nr:hypothetical protein [Rhizobium sp. BK512]MBB3565238.1 hypothetical protein [Rhizobium sp. BK512]